MSETVGPEKNIYSVFRIIGLAENSRQIFDFKGLIRKILRNKDLGRMLGCSACLPLQSIDFKYDNLQSIHNKWLTLGALLSPRLILCSRTTGSHALRPGLHSSAVSWLRLSWFGCQRADADLAATYIVPRGVKKKGERLDHGGHGGSRGKSLDHEPSRFSVSMAVGGRRAGIGGCALHPPARFLLILYDGRSQSFNGVFHSG